MSRNDLGCLKTIHVKEEVLGDDIASKFTKLERRCQLLSIYVKTAKKMNTPMAKYFPGQQQELTTKIISNP